MKGDEVLSAQFLLPLLQKSLSRGETAVLTIRSNSMAPLLKTGDKVGITAVSSPTLPPGDIITLFTPPDDLLTHRYWGNITQNGRMFLHTRGDRVWQFDVPHPNENLVGKVIVRWRQERPFPLTTGLGRWLNHHLYQLAQLEYRLVTGHPWQIASKHPPTAQLTPYQRAIRHTLKIWASTITQLTTAH